MVSLICGTNGFMPFFFLSLLCKACDFILCQKEKAKEKWDKKGMDEEGKQEDVKEELNWDKNIFKVIIMH